MNVIRELPHVLAVINAATIVVLLRAYSLIRARDREGHRRTMFVAVGLGVAFLAARDSCVYGLRGRGARAGDLLQRAQTAVRYAQAAGAFHVPGVALCRGLWPRRLRDGGPSLSDERQLTFHDSNGANSHFPQSRAIRRRRKERSPTGAHRMGVARRRRARRRWRVRASSGAVAYPRHGEDAVLADRLLLQG